MASATTFSAPGGAGVGRSARPCSAAAAPTPPSGTPSAGRRSSAAGAGGAGGPAASAASATISSANKSRSPVGGASGVGPAGLAGPGGPGAPAAAGGSTPVSAGPGGPVGTGLRPGRIVRKKTAPQQVVQWKTRNVQEGIVIVDEAQLSRLIKRDPISKYYDMDPEPFAT